MDYTSTRNAARRLQGAQAILTGLSPDGGLFVPVEIGTIDFESMPGSSYEEIACRIFKHFLPEYSEHFLKEAVNASYGENFNNRAGQLEKVSDGLYSLELWHGPTSAFKDYALQIMPKLFSQARKMMNVDFTTLILVATSGDTGSAALNGYCDLEGVKIAVFYPDKGTSEIQRLQMVTQKGSNVAVYGISGNFDDAQSGVKAAFCSDELANKLAEKRTKLSSANSINWGRLCPQIVYYVSTYLKLCMEGTIQYGEEVDFSVPTGNFGDIMAGYYAKKLGLPIGKLICASNKNNVLSEFLKSGTYTSKREFYQTTSPSMDILISSNLERLLYHESGDAIRVKKWMEQLSKEGRYTVGEDVMAKIRKTFSGDWVEEEEVLFEIEKVYNKYSYLCDPHTAVAFSAAKKAATGHRPIVVISTASPFKFCKSVLKALGADIPEDEFDALKELEKISGKAAPEALAALKGKEQRFNEVISPADIMRVPLTL